MDGDDSGRMAVSHLARRDLGPRTIGEAVTRRGKELRIGDTVATARRLFANESVQVLPVLDGRRYVGAIERETLPEHLSDDAPVEELAAPLLPTAAASTPATDALDALDASGATRLVVLAEDRATYLGIVCLRSDRERLCIDAECHPPA
jgi:predicted transcriptional regulator